MAGALAGIRVIDLSRILAGPFCTMMLGDLGADVIKIEQPGSGDDTRTWGPPFIGGQAGYYLAINRNKRSVTLNLKDERAKALLLRLVEGADVLIENFKVGGLAAMGLGYDRLREVNPRLVHCSISGFGPDGPYAQRPGYDFVAQAMGGAMSITGEPDGQPMKFGVAISDLTTGMYSCIAILAALRHRDETGQGQHIDTSLIESTTSLLINFASTYLLTGEMLPRLGNAHPNIVPYRLFKASDKWFIVAVGNDRQFEALCSVIERPELAQDVRYRQNKDRVARRDEVESLLSEVFAGREAAYWTERLLAVGVPSGPVNSVADVFADPQVLTRQMLLEMPHPTIGTLKTAGFPFKLGETPAEARRHPPLLGEHTAEVLRELLELPDQEIEELRAGGVV
jgi:formyl-CoA transferase